MTPAGVLIFIAVLFASASVRADEPEKKRDQPGNADAAEKRPAGINAGAKKADAKPADEPKADAKTIYRKFQARTDIQADKTPLKDLVAQLSKRHGIPIRLDEPAFKKAGIALDVPVTASIKNFTLNAALQHVLKDLKLHHVVKDGVVLVTTGEEQAVPEAEIEAAERPVAVPAARVVRPARAPLVEVAVDPAADAAAVAAMEKQFTRRFRAALASELRFVARVCEPTEEQLDGIRDVLEKYRADLVTKFSDVVQKRNKVGGQQRRAAPAFPEPRPMVRASVARTVKTNLTAEQVARFEKEIESRNLDRSRAAIDTLVTRLDEALTLSAEQREKVTRALSVNFNAAWLQNFETMLLQGNVVIPNGIERLVEPSLNPTQRTIWRRLVNNGNPGNQAVVQGGIGFIGGGAMAIVDLIGDDDGDPEEEDEDEAEDENAGANDDGRVGGPRK